MHAIPAARRKLIERIATAARSLKRRGDPVAPDSFVKLYYHGVAEEDLAQYTPEELAAAALGHLRFAAQRRRGKPAIRLYSPSEDAAHTFVEVVVEDMPFLVDSLAMVLNQAGCIIDLMVHPVLAVRRDRAGRLLDVVEESAAQPPLFRESWQQIRIDRIVDEHKLQALHDRIAETLEDVRLAVTDWQAMCAQATAIGAEIERDADGAHAGDAREIKALLDWMVDNHFTFLGYREYRLRRGRSEDVLEALPDTGLGILRARPNRHLEPTRLRGELRERARDPERLIITKANSIATVHRATYLDYIGIKVLDRAGNVTGEKRFLGLFTSAAYSHSPLHIPLLRHKIQRVIDHFGLPPDSHDGKAVLHVLETYPRDELFQARVAELTRIVRGVVNLYERQRVRVFARRDPFGRFYSALIYVPRDRYSTRVREKIEEVIRATLHATAIESQVQLSESALARVHMIIRLPSDGGRRVDVEALEERIADAIRTWEDRLREALIAAHGEMEGRALAERYAGAFPAAYQADVAVNVALEDIEHFEEVFSGAAPVALRMRAGAAPATVHLRLFRADAPITLSQTLPIIENMGFIVLSERPYRIEVGGSTLWLQDFSLQRSDGAPVDPAEIGARFTEAFAAIWLEHAEDDGFNRLVATASLTWRQAMVLRAYCRFILQAGIAFDQAYMEHVLATNGPITTLLWRLFEAQFDPALTPPQRKTELARVQKDLARRLDAVKSLDEDRVLRRFADAIGATLRTNYYQKDAAGVPKAYLSLKLDSRSLADLPQPRPAFEIFVYSPRVEGVHLRMGAVARGGLRWSDRHADFRTEVLGLLKAQNVKNTLIVPVGAKGGFVTKRMPANASREESQREVVECYSTFIRGLLDVTDNIVEGRVVPPQDVVRRDHDDPYLVVAADKGTATFSDIANDIAAEYDFWLGDAFASGGSVGYDHKKMGITARGAWECVKRHFREIGIDTQAQEFTAVGIGDMSGDVFGNGMLRSQHIKLVAAFNHQHIFIDPDPDPAASYAERARLFGLPRSTWEDYDPKLISKGGGVFSRSAKSIHLSPEAQAVLGLHSETVTPPELIRAILCAPVDLLWNGGIGTYVKASDETHAEVGDRANDAVRVNGRDLRCRIVGEGGNLGFSQRGRIEYALNGGRINTDFIDNSGGVDCSDHEVNIKILLAAAREHGDLTLARRNRMLADMTEEVAALVLRDNYLQSQALSMMEARSAADLLEHAHTIRSLELAGKLDRALEFLPSVEEIAERRKAGRGLTRPELAVLLAYSKMSLYTRLIDSDVPEDPYLGNELGRYFPKVLQKRFEQHMARHPLRREIIATATTNSMINRMGPTFARRAQEDTGVDAASVVRAYAIARESYDIRKTWSEIEALDNRIAAAMQYELMIETAQLLRFCTYWLLTRQPDRLVIEQQVKRFKDGFTQLAAALPRVLSGLDLAAFQERRARYLQAGVPQRLSEFMASALALRSAPDIVEIAAQRRIAIETAAAEYFALSSALSLDWIRDQIEALNVEGHWQAVARGTLRDNIYALQRQLCLQVLGEPKSRGAARGVEGWLARRRDAVEYVRQTVTDMRALPAMDFATLSVALQAVRRLAERA